MSGYTILGSGQSTGPAGPDRVITIRLKNALALAKGQSALASAASFIPGVGPEFVEGQTYEAVAQKIGESLAEQKAIAEIKVIDGSGIIPQPKTYFSAAAVKRPPVPGVPGVPGTPEQESEVWKFARTYKFGVVAGVGLTGIALAIWQYFFATKESA